MTQLTRSPSNPVRLMFPRKAPEQPRPNETPEAAFNPKVAGSIPARPIIRRFWSASGREEGAEGRCVMVEGVVPAGLDDG